jgi:hypothetical protein
MKRAKKRVGRPPGRTAAHRPVVAARVPQALYDELNAAAAAAGRTTGEQLVWGAKKAAEWEQAFGELREWQAKFREDNAAIQRGNVEAVLFALNWKKVRGATFGQPNWISPDNHEYPASGFVDLGGGERADNVEETQ